MDKEHLKREADRLANDTVLQTALANMRVDALERLANANASDVKEVLKFQMKVAAIDSFASELAAMINSAAPLNKHVAI